MSKRNNICIIVTIMVSCTAFAKEKSLQIGVDLLQSNYTAKKGTVGEVFYTDPITFNFFGKYNFVENFFIEAGYEVHSGKNKSKDMSQGEIFANGIIPDPNFYTIDVNTKIKTEHPYIGIGFYNYVPRINNATWFAMLGVSNSKVKADLNYYRTIIGVNREERVPFIFSKRKIIPIIKLGLDYKFKDSFGVRLTASWLNMNRIKLVSKRSNAVETRMRNGYSFGVGLFYNFI